MLYSSVLKMLKYDKDDDNLVGYQTRWGRLSADLRVVALGNQPEHCQRVPALPRQVGVEDIRDGRPAPRGGGGSPPRPAPPRKNDQNHREVAGQNKGLILNFYRTQVQS